VILFFLTITNLSHLYHQNLSNKRWEQLKHMMTAYNFDSLAKQ